MLSRMQIENPEEIEAQERLRRAAAARKMNFQHSQEQSAASGGQREAVKAETFVREERKVGRNEPCPCGSGKKYKQCCGRR